MLAIVNFAAVGQRIGSSSAPQVRTLFQQTNTETRLTQRDGGGHPRQTAADHQNVSRGHLSSTSRSYQPRADIALFRRSTTKCATRIHRSRKLLFGRANCCRFGSRRAMWSGYRDLPARRAERRLHRTAKRVPPGVATFHEAAASAARAGFRSGSQNARDLPAGYRRGPFRNHRARRE